MPHSKRKRNKTVYKAHELRNGVVHSFPVSGVPEMSVLLGELALLPDTDATYHLQYPISLNTKAPSVTVRFVSREDFPTFINCERGAPPVPIDFDNYDRVKVKVSSKKEKIAFSPEQPGHLPENWARFLSLQSVDSLPKKAEINRITLTFRTGTGEGVYIVSVDTGEQPAEPYEGAPVKPYTDHVFIYCKESTTFSDDDPEVGKLIADGVNLCRKNGWLWFAHPIYFAEQILNMQLAQSVKEDIAYCEDLPDDLPAPDIKLVQIQWGRNLAGMGRICLSVDGEIDDCIETEGMAVQVSNPIELTNLLRERNV